MQDSTPDKGNSVQKSGNNRAGFPPKYNEKRKLKHYQGRVPTCVLHGEGHSTEECKSIQNWAKKQKTDYAHKKDYKTDGKSNKWTKKSSSDKKFSKNDLNAMVAKAVKASVQEAFAMNTDNQNGKDNGPGDENDSTENDDLELENIEINADLFSEAESNNDSSSNSSQENNE